MSSITRLSLRLCLIFGVAYQACAQIVFDPVKNTCGQPGSSNAILDDVVAMANAALGYMNNVASNAQSSNTKDHWDTYRVATIFDTIFDSTSSGAQDRWNTVQSNLQALANLASNQPDVYVFCDDSQFFSPSPSNGQQVTFTSPIDGSTHQITGLLQCGDASSNGRYQIAYRTRIDNVEYVSICTSQNQYATNLASLSYTKGTSIEDTQTWSTTFFHEIMHVLPLNQVGDQSGGVGAGGERYGWVDAYSIRSSYGTQNPDSLKLFAMALSMEEYLWHSGTAVEFKDEYDRLSALQGDTTIQSLSLPSPAAGPWT